MASDDEFEEMVMAVASGTLDIEQLVIWFRQRTRFWV